MSLLIKNGIIVTASDLYRGDVFIDGETISTGVCKQAWFRDPDGNRLMLHRRFDA